MKYLSIATAFLIALFSQGCSSSVASDNSAFNNWLNSAVEKIQQSSPNYRRIPIDTDKQVNAFTEVSYKFYKKEITKAEFIQRMESQYPSYSVSIKTLADALTK